MKNLKKKGLSYQAILDKLNGENISTNGVSKMEKGKNEIYIGGKKCKIEFTRLIGTWPGGGKFVECEYKIIFEKEIVRLYLQLIKECPDYKEIGEPGQEEIGKGFTRSKEGQEKFFRNKGKKIVIETLIRVGGIKGIRKLGCGQIPYSYVPHSKIASVVIKDVEKRN